MLARYASELSAVELFRLTLSTENVFTSAHAERVVDQLRSQPTSPVIAGCLLRCVCHIKWEVAAWPRHREGAPPSFP